MARIQTYIVDTVLSDTDLILGSNADNSLDTVNFKLSDVKTYVLGTGVVTSVSGTGTVSGLTLTGTVTSSGNLTLGGTLALTSSDITSGLGFTPYNATNPSGFTSNPSYDYGAVGAAGNINMALTGSDGSNDVVTMQAGSNITLTDNGSNTFTIASTGGGGSGGVTSFTNVNGQFVSAAISNSGATGAVTTGAIDLSATGSPSSTTYLRGDNTWATPPGSDTVTQVAAEVIPNTSALDVTVANSTTNPNISIAWQGPDNTRLVAGDGTLVLPVITSITTNNSSGVATLANNVLNIPDYSGSSITLTTTGTTGPATLAGGVLNVPNYSSNPGSGTVTRVGALNGTFISSSSADITSTGDLTYDLSATGTPSATSFLRGDNTWATPAGSGTVYEVTGGQTAFVRVTTTNPTTTPVITAALTATGQTPDTGNFLRGDNQWADAIILTTNGTSGAAQFNSTTGTLNIPQYLSSAVQSVGVSMPSAFTVSNSPVTSSGTIAVTGAGTGAQYINGLGALAAISTIPANINLTTTGTSGAATFSSNNLNIPQYVTPPAGSTGDVQFNAGSGQFGAEGEFNYATSTNTLTITGVVNQPSLKLASAQPTTPTAGALLSEIESYYSSAEVGKIKFVADGSFNPSSNPSRLEIQTTPVNSTVADTKLEIANNGQLRLNKYGSSAPFSGAPVSSLAVDANGYVIENAFSRPASATNISYNTNLNPAANQYSVESVSSGSIGAPSGNGKVRVRYTTSAQAQNVEEITVANNQLDGTSNALALQNMAVGGTITLNQVGGGASGILTYTIKSRTNETGYVRFELTFVSGSATYVILTTTTDAFTFTADYEHVLSGGYNRLSVTNASGSTTNRFRMAPPAVATPGQEIIVELNRSSTTGTNMIPAYVVRDGNSTFLKTRSIVEIEGTTINVISLGTNDTAIIKFQVNVIGSVKGLTVLGSNQMIYG